MTREEREKNVRHFFGLAMGSTLAILGYEINMPWFPKIFAGAWWGFYSWNLWRKAAGK